MDDRRSMSLFEEEILPTIFLFVFFPPAILERLSGVLDILQKVVQVAAILTLVYLIWRKRGMRLSSSHALWAVFGAYALVNTAVNGIWNIYHCITALIVPIVTVILLCLYYQSEPDGMERLTRCMARYLMALVALNAIAMLLFPHGIIQSSEGSTHDRANWLLGSKNNVVWPLLLAVVFALMEYRQDTRAKRASIAGIVILAFLEVLCSGEHGVQFRGGSTTGLVALLAVILLFCERRKLARSRFKILLTPPAAFVIFLLASAVIIFSCVYELPLISAVFRILGKDPSASGRAHAWASALQVIRVRPIFGCGFITLHFYKSLVSPYNMYLNLLFRFGVVGFLIVFATLCTYHRADTASPDNEKALILLIGIAGLFTCGIVNTVVWNYLLILLEMYFYSGISDATESEGLWLSW